MSRSSCLSRRSSPSCPSSLSSPLRSSRPPAYLSAGRVGMRAALGQHGPKVLAGIGGFNLGNLRRRAGCHDDAAVFAAFGAQVDQIVRGLDDVEIVLDDEQRVSRFEELPERGEQLRDVIEMQPRGRLVENVEKPFTAVRRQVRRDLDPLSLTTRQRRSGLSQAEVAEADLVEHVQTPQHLWRAAEESERLSNGEVEHLMDRTSAVA